jgi:hypothetical protein
MLRGNRASCDVTNGGEGTNAKRLGDAKKKKKGSGAKNGSIFLLDLTCWFGLRFAVISRKVQQYLAWFFAWARWRLLEQGIRARMAPFGLSVRTEPLLAQFDNQAIFSALSSCIREHQASGSC